MPAPAYVDTNTIQVPALTTPRTSVSAAWGIAVRDDLEFLAKPPRAKVRRTTTQAIAHNTNTPVIFDTEDYDYAAGNFGGTAGGAAWSVGAATKLFVPVGGTYDIKAGGQFAINATGARILFLLVNGITTLSATHGAGTAAWFVGSTLCSDAKLAAGDFVELWAYQASGAPLNIDVTYPVFLSMRLAGLT